MSEIFFSTLGKIIAYGGGSVAIAYAAFTFFGKKWIENLFQKKIELYKHEQAKEIEHLKYQINSLLNRVTKIHEKEFEVLPAAWNKLYDALEMSSSFTSTFQQYPDLDRFSPDELSKFVTDCKLHEFQKNELLKSENKTEYYREKIFFHDLSEARKIYSEFHKYITRNRIFLSSDLRMNFQKIDGILSESLLKKEIGEEAKDYKMIVQAHRDIRNQVSEIIETIENLVQDRLRYREAT
jgi:hypothetical protein